MNHPSVDLDYEVNNSLLVFFLLSVSEYQKSVTSLGLCFWWRKSILCYVACHLDTVMHHGMSSHNFFLETWPPFISQIAVQWCFNHFSGVTRCVGVKTRLAHISYEANSSSMENLACTTYKVNTKEAEIATEISDNHTAGTLYISLLIMINSCTLPLYALLSEYKIYAFIILLL